MGEEKKRRIRLSPDATERECTKCGITKPLAAFPLRRGGRPSSWCRECTNGQIRAYARTSIGAAKKKAAQDAYNARNPDYQVGYRYGLKPGEYAAMVVAQDGRCAICRTTDPGGRNGKWCVDHCHESTRVRGLLCVHCNMAIGQMADDPARLRAAADYLEQAECPPDRA